MMEKPILSIIAIFLLVTLSFAAPRDTTICEAYLKCHPNKKLALRELSKMEDPKKNIFDKFVQQAINFMDERMLLRNDLGAKNSALLAE